MSMLLTLTLSFFLVKFNCAPFADCDVCMLKGPSVEPAVEEFIPHCRTGAEC